MSSQSSTPLLIEGYPAQPAYARGHNAEFTKIQQYYKKIKAV